LLAASFERLQTPSGVSSLSFKSHCTTGSLASAYRLRDVCMRASDQLKIHSRDGTDSDRRIYSEAVVGS
jgi:hypothetical protein